MPLSAPRRATNRTIQNAVTQKPYCTPPHSASKMAAPRTNRFFFSMPFFSQKRPGCARLAENRALARPCTSSPARRPKFRLCGQAKSIGHAKWRGGIRPVSQRANRVPAVGTDADKKVVDNGRRICYTFAPLSERAASLGF